MRIIVVGATGTIGSAVCDALASHHEVVTVGYKDGRFMLTSSLDMPVATAAHAYLASVEGDGTAHIIDPRRLAAK